MLAGTYVGSNDFVRSASQVQALDFGPGIHDPSVGGFAGGYIHDLGYVLYCLELGKLPDMANSAPALNLTNTIPAYQASWIQQGSQVFNNVGAGALTSDSSQYKRLAFLMGKYGQTSNNEQAAALALAIWQIRGEVGKTGDYDALLNAERGMAGAGATNRATQMVAEASAWLQAGGNEGGTVTSQPGKPSFILQGAYKGQIKVTKGTTKIVLNNAVFSQSGKSTMTWEGPGLASDAVFDLDMQPSETEAWNRYYSVSAKGSYVYFTPGASKIYTTQGSLLDQSTGYAEPGEPKTHTGEFETVYADPDALWAPTLTTEVPSEFVKKGEEFADTVTFDVASGEGFDAWRWYMNSKNKKQHAPITANGTLYGPFPSDPALNPSDKAPAGAPVAGHATITTDLNKGPGTYLVETDLKAKESGYYTWKWDIDWKDQSKAVTNPPAGNASIPENYFFTDGFGRATEGQTVPTSLVLGTELSAPEVVIGGTLTDEVEVSLVDGVWLRGDDGKRLPYDLVGTVYTQKGEPIQQAAAPAEATELTKVTMTVDDTGKFNSEKIRVPLNVQDDYLTVQWCVTGATQPGNSKNKVEDFCDDYGVPSETAKVLRPDVTTQAQKVGAVKDYIHDVALVKDPVPDVPLEVDFTLYLKPEPGQPKYDEDWNEVLDENGEPVLWTDAEVSDPAAVCEAQPVAKTDRVPVDGAGEYKSPDVLAKTEGTAYWVEELFGTEPGDKGDNGEEISIHRGQCGLPNETTVIEYPSVKTKATSDATVGQKIEDTAIVTGPLSTRKEISYEVTFEAYHRGEGTTSKIDENLCTPDTKVWESTKPTPVATEGEYKSEKWEVKEEHIGEILWVETLTEIEKTDKGEKRTEIHRGACGEVDEITKVTPKEQLAFTGAFGAPLIVSAGVVLLLGGAALAFAARRKSASLADTNI